MVWEYNSDVVYSEEERGLDDTKKMNSDQADDEKFKSIFDTDGSEDWDDDLEEREIQEKIRENKLKSMKEHRRSGNHSDSGSRRAHRKR